MQPMQSSHCEQATQARQRRQEMQPKQAAHPLISNDSAVTALPATAALPKVAIDPATATLEKVPSDPATATLPTVPSDPATATLPTVPMEPATMALPTVANDASTPTPAVVATDSGARSNLKIIAPASQAFGELAGVLGQTGSTDSNGFDRQQIIVVSVRKQADRKPLSGRIANVTVVDECYPSEIDSPDVHEDDQEFRMTSLTVRRGHRGGGAMTAALRSAVVSGGLAVAMVWPATAGADPAGGSNASPPNTDSIGSAISEFGQSICPKLVKPGSDLATTLSQMQGNTGLTPTIAGMATGLAIQMECPAFMTSVANGKLPLSGPQLPGTSPAAGSPLALPGLTAPKLPALALPAGLNPPGGAGSS